MAQLKDTIINGDLQVSNTLKTDYIYIDGKGGVSGKQYKLVITDDSSITAAEDEIVILIGA